MAEFVTAAATAVAEWASATAYAVATGAGLSAGTASTISIYAAAAAYAATGFAIHAGVTMGLGALTAAQVPDPESGKMARKQSRPLRSFAVGGPSRMSGAYMLRETIGNKLGVVLAICEGRLASIDAVYLNDDLVTLDGAGWVAGMTNERYGGGDLVQITTRLGLPTETHHSILTPDFGALWPITARGDGIASLAMLAQHRSKESFSRHFPHGEPMPSVVVRPVCYDWRDETQDREDEASWKECRNPVIWAAHCEWARFGRSWARCIAPRLAELTAEADYCDELVLTAAGASVPRYEVAGNYFSNTEPSAIRAAILSTMDGWMSSDGKGGLIIKAGRYVEPAFTITAEHIRGYSWRAWQTDEEACNVLIVSYVEPLQNYTDVEAGQWRDASDIADTGVERTENLALTWVGRRSQAMRLAKRKMSRTTAARRGTIRTDIHGLNGLGERYIRVQNPEVATMADVVVEVMNVEIDFAAAQVVFDVILADENIDAWNPAEEEGEAPDPVEQPDPVEDAAPVLVSATPFSESIGTATGVRLTLAGSGPDREDLTWSYEVRAPGDTDWLSNVLSDEAAGPPLDGRTWFVPAVAALEVRIIYETGGSVVRRSNILTVDTLSPPALPTMPSGLWAEDNGDTPDGATVEWNNGSDVTAAVVYIGGPADAFEDATGDSGDLTATPGTTQTHNYVTPPGTYRIWVTNKNAAGESVPAGPTNVTVV